MTGGFPNKPKVLRGAFVEYGLSLPPLFVVFQFNPEQLTRSRTLSILPPGGELLPPPKGQDHAGNRSAGRGGGLREFHQKEFKGEDDLLSIQRQQVVTLQEEAISFDIRLDASDDLNDGNPIAEQVGLYPKIATLELMVHPKGESILGGLADELPFLKASGFSFTKKPNPPINLFIWGRQRVLPVNLDSLSITETEFNTNLDPIRATASVSLSVIEGKNIPYTYSKAVKEAMSVLNLANIADISNVVIPG